MVALRRGGEWEAGLRLFNRLLQAEGLAPDAHCFGAALACCNTGGQHARALEIFEEMPRRGVEPNRHCYNEAVAACRSTDGEAMCDKCLSLLEEMPGGELKEAANSRGGSYSSSSHSSTLTPRRPCPRRRCLRHWLQRSPRRAARR
jgi:pentatricopeptide repeat protein